MPPMSTRRPFAELAALGLQTFVLDVRDTASIAAAGPVTVLFSVLRTIGFTRLSATPNIPKLILSWISFNLNPIVRNTLVL